MHRMLHVLAVAGLLVGCGEPAPAPDTEEQIRVQERAELDRFFATAWEERLALSPELRARVGQRIDYGLWDDRSSAGIDREYFLTQGQWDTLQKTVDYVRLDPERRRSYDLFIDEVQQLGERYRWRHHRYLLDQQGGVHRDVPTFLINTHAVRDEADALAYVSRLNGVPALFAQIEERLAVSEQEGVLPPKFVYGHVIREARNVLRGRPYESRGEDNLLLRDLKDKLAATSIPEQRRTELAELASAALLQSVRPAYESLIRALENQATRATTDDGVWKLPNGAQYYRAQLRWHTTTDLTPDEIHALGLTEVARIQDELQAFMTRQQFRGTLRQFFAYMARRDDLYYPDTDAGRQAYLDAVTAKIAEMQARLPEAFSTVPTIPVVVKPVEAFREATAGRAFYLRPAVDGSRPGTYYVNLSRMRELPKYDLEALAYHETVPGHHLQRASTLTLDTLPEFRKRYAASAYTEGWGLYAERLAADLGGYSDSIARYGQLVQELTRAARLVVDTGIHARRWTREQAIQYHLENTSLSVSAATRAVERYIVEPGQACAYSIGMLRIVELRDRARAELGDRFSLHEFHDTVLGSGPVPLNTLERIVNAWIGGRRESVSSP